MATCEGQSHVNLHRSRKSAMQRLLWVTSKKTLWRNSPKSCGNANTFSATRSHRGFDTVVTSWLSEETHNYVAPSGGLALVYARTSSAKPRARCAAAHVASGFLRLNSFSSAACAAHVSLFSSRLFPQGGCATQNAHLYPCTAPCSSQYLKRKYHDVLRISSYNC